MNESPGSPWEVSFHGAISPGARQANLGWSVFRSPVLLVAHLR